MTTKPQNRTVQQLGSAVPHFFLQKVRRFSRTNTDYAFRRYPIFYSRCLLGGTVKIDSGLVMLRLRRLGVTSGRWNLCELRDAQTNVGRMLGKCLVVTPEDHAPPTEVCTVRRDTRNSIRGDSCSDILKNLAATEGPGICARCRVQCIHPGPWLSLVARYEPEIGGRIRTQGQMIVFSIVWVARSWVKHQP